MVGRGRDGDDRCGGGMRLKNVFKLQTISNGLLLWMLLPSAVSVSLD